MRRNPALLDVPWRMRPAAEHPEALTLALARSLSLPLPVARLLHRRGYRDPADARTFLAPRLSDLVPPTALPDAAKAAERIARAVRSNERIAVFGDYDVDGMTGTSILLRFLRLAGADATWEIPDRDSQGYGLSPAAVERLAASGVRLIVTVDNGVSAHEAVARGNELGVDTVVTDHHLPGPTLPPAHAIVNPNCAPGGPSGAPLCGCALAFKTAWAVAERLRSLLSGDQADRFRSFLRDAVGLVALATVADVMPLVGENRVLVSTGLASLASSPHPGVRALLESAAAASGGLTGPLTTEDVAFRLAPRINAAGRLSRPEVVVELFTTEDPARARELARDLERANETRRGIERRVLEEATEQARRVLDGSGRQSLVVSGQGWHRGVIGIVAARLVDLHQRPTVVIGLEGEQGRGSCRSRPEVDLHRVLTLCGAHLDRFGGHAMAAGLEIRRGAVETFAEAFEEAVKAESGALGPRALLLDGESTPADWDLPACEALQRLAPFGAGNPEPVFLLRSVRAAGRPRLLGTSQGHLAFALARAGAPLRVVAFRRPDLFDTVSSGEPLDLAVVPTVNEWRGVRSPEMRLVDLRPASDAPVPV